jgi:glycosyltransferase involved in cell wall biosynthesis
MSDIRRILFVTGQLECGGSERQLFNLAEALHETGIQVKVASFNSHDDHYSLRFRALGVEVECLPGGLMRVARLRRLVRDWKPQVVHSFSNFTNFPVWLAIRGLPAAGVGSWRSDYRAPLLNYGRLRFWLNTHWPETIVINSMRALNEARAEMPERASSFVVVENGVNLREYEIQKIPSLPTCELLGIGSLTKVKRWDRALRVLRLLKDKRLPVNLSIAGAGLLREALERLARDLHIERSIRFLGLVEDVARLIPRYHCVIHTAESEGAPNAALEALACGRPVVAMNSGDIGRILRCQNGEYLVQQGNEAGMAEEIEKLINTPRSFERVGRANRAWMEENYSIERSTRGMLAAYAQARRRQEKA